MSIRITSFVDTRWTCVITALYMSDPTNGQMKKPSIPSILVCFCSDRGCGCLLSAVAAGIIFDDAPLLYSYGNSVCFNPAKRLSPTNSFILRLQLIHGMCDCMSTAHATKTILLTSRPKPELQRLTFNLLIDGQVWDCQSRNWNWRDCSSDRI